MSDVSEDETPETTEAEPTEASEETAAEETPAEDPLAAVTEERDKIKDQLLRTAAELDNTRKRHRRELLDERHRAKADAVREFLPIVDNLQRAADAAGSAEDVNAVAEGVRMVLRSFDDVAERLGLAAVPGVGERFDPTVHEAVQQIHTPDIEQGAIAAVIAGGYRLGEKLLRPAMVVVSKGPAEPAPEPEAPAADEAPAESEDA